MHWKKYKALSPAQKNNEAYYIIGLDIGNDSSSVAFFNAAENAAETIDFSGGYGRPSVPTVMQYIAETKEWVFGEYAILNKGVGAEVTLSALIERLGQYEYVDLDHKPVSVVQVLSLFIKELLSNVKNINPKAEIVGIVAAVPGYFSDQAREELARAFKLAGYEKELIAQVSDRECVLAREYHGRQPGEERALIIDYGSREVRGGLYRVAPKKEGVVSVTSMSSLFDESLGAARVNEDVRAMFEGFLAAQTPAPSPQTLEYVSAFAYQHRDMLFQKNIRSKPIKLYFNFAYPPFQQTVTHAQADALVAAYRQRFNAFIHEALEKSLYADAAVRPGDIDRVLCVGGGFEMLWAREVVGGLFKRVTLYKNAKVVAAEGAAVVAARLLGAAEGYHFELEDRHQLQNDIGIAGDTFLPLAERNAFWWQRHPARLVLVNAPVSGDLPFVLAERNADGEVRTLKRFLLTHLPERPAATTRLEVRLQFSSNTQATVEVADAGFGELFPGVAYERRFEVGLG